MKSVPVLAGHAVGHGRQRRIDPVLVLESPFQHADLQQPTTILANNDGSDFGEADILSRRSPRRRRLLRPAKETGKWPIGIDEFCSSQQRAIGKAPFSPGLHVPDDRADQPFLVFEIRCSSANRLVTLQQLTHAQPAQLGNLVGDIELDHLNIVTARGYSTRTVSLKSWPASSVSA